MSEDNEAIDEVLHHKHPVVKLVREQMKNVNDPMIEEVDESPEPITSSSPQLPENAAHSSRSLKSDSPKRIKSDVGNVADDVNERSSLGVTTGAAARDRSNRSIRETDGGDSSARETDEGDRSGTREAEGGGKSSARETDGGGSSARDTDGGGSNARGTDGGGRGTGDAGQSQGRKGYCTSSMILMLLIWLVLVYGAFIGANLCGTLSFKNKLCGGCGFGGFSSVSGPDQLYSRAVF